LIIGAERCRNGLPQNYLTKSQLTVTEDLFGWWRDVVVNGVGLSTKLIDTGPG